MSGSGTVGPIFALTVALRTTDANEEWADFFSKVIIKAYKTLYYCYYRYKDETLFFEQ